MRNFKFPCSSGDHAECRAVYPIHTALVCYCVCHERHSVACRLGAHSLCDRSECECACRHDSTSERVAARNKWAA